MILSLFESLRTSTCFPPPQNCLLNVPEGSGCFCLRPPSRSVRFIQLPAAASATGGFTPAAVWGSAGPASAYCPNPVAFLPPTLIVITFPARPFLPPSTALCHFIRFAWTIVSPEWVIYPRQRGSGCSLLWFNQVILGRGNGGRSLLGNKGSLEWEKQRIQHFAASGRSFPSRSSTWEWHIKVAQFQLQGRH